MGTNLILADQIGQAFLAELNQNTPDSIQVKNKLKGFSECNPNPGAEVPPTMSDAFNAAVADERVIARFRELRDSLPISNFSERKHQRYQLTDIYNPHPQQTPSDRPLSGLVTPYASGFTDSVDLQIHQEPTRVDDSNFSTSELTARGRYHENDNSFRVTETGVYLLHGVITYGINMPEGITTNEIDWHTADPAEVIRHALYVSVNSGSSTVKATENQEASLDIPNSEIVNRLDTYFVHELHSGKFTKNEILKDIIKTRGFSLYLKLTLNDVVSFQWQRSRSIASFWGGEGGTEELCFRRNPYINDTVVDGEDVSTYDKGNWIEFVRML